MASFNFHKFNLYISILVSVLVLQGCGSDSTTTESVTSTETTSNPETLVESLDRLGVDTEITPRIDSQGNPYPDVYAPP